MARPAYPTVARALDAVRAGEVEASVPIENSIEGGVSAALDSPLPSSPLQIVAEVVLPVSFDLCVRPGTNLRAGRTHHQSSARHRAGARLAGREPARRDGGGAWFDRWRGPAVSFPDSDFDAAVCAPVAGEMYGLVSLAKNISDNDSAPPASSWSPGPVSARSVLATTRPPLVAYMRQDHPGALLEILQQLAVRGEPVPDRVASDQDDPGRVLLQHGRRGHISDARMAEALMGLHRICKDVVFLGSYPRATASRPRCRSVARTRTTGTRTRG